MRILLTASTFPTQLNDGTPRFIYDLAESLTHHADVSVLAPETKGAPLHEQLGSVDIHRFSYFFPRSWQALASEKGRSMRDNMRSSLIAKLQVPSFLLRQVYETRKLIRRQNISAVNAHWLVPQGLTAAFALRSTPNIPLILHIHAGDVYMLTRMAVGPAIAKYVVSRSAAIFADGSHVRDTLDELIGRESGAVIQPMGVAETAFTRDGNEDLESLGADFPNGFILFVGRLAEKKGLKYLIQAMKQVNARFHGVGLVIVGSGPLESELRKQTTNEGLDASVRFVGSQPHSEVVRYLHACRLVAVPSIVDPFGETEGMPTVIAEALTAGTLVVASDVAGIPDVIEHGRNGWLCEQRNAKDLCDKLCDALGCLDRERIVASATSTSSRFHWRNIAQTYIDCIEQRIALCAPQGRL